MPLQDNGYSAREIGRVSVPDVVCQEYGILAKHLVLKVLTPLKAVQSEIWIEHLRDKGAVMLGDVGVDLAKAFSTKLDTRLRHISFAQDPAVAKVIKPLNGFGFESFALSTSKLLITIDFRVLSFWIPNDRKTVSSEPIRLPICQPNQQPPA